MGRRICLVMIYHFVDNTSKASSGGRGCTQKNLVLVVGYDCRAGLLHPHNPEKLHQIVYPILHSSGIYSVEFPEVYMPFLSPWICSSHVMRAQRLSTRELLRLYEKSCCTTWQYKSYFWNRFWAWTAISIPALWVSPPLMSTFYYYYMGSEAANIPTKRYRLFHREEFRPIYPRKQGQGIWRYALKPWSNNKRHCSASRKPIVSP